MIATIWNSQLHGQIEAIPSKSVAHRLLILAGLSKCPTKIRGIYMSDDVKASISCLKSLGVMFGKDSIIGGNFNHNAELNVNESGSTLRFLLPIVSAIGGKFEFNCKGKLLSRPNDALYRVLENHGVRITHGEIIEVSGQLQSGKYEISGSISSQYISGLLMALPLLNGDSEIVLTSPLSSKDYIDITLSALDKFGIKIEQTKYGYKIFGNQNYLATGELSVEGDWSNGAFFLVYSAIKGGVNVSNLNIDSKQGDKNIIEVLEKVGGKIRIENGIITVQKKSVKPIILDVDNIIDLTPILAVLVACSAGKSVFTNVKRLRLKECDRVKAIVEMLCNIGIEAYANENEIHIQGGKIQGGIINSYNDHRIAMAGAIAGLVSAECVTIEHAEAINKSYPTFFEDIKALGGVLNVKI